MKTNNYLVAGTFSVSTTGAINNLDFQDCAVIRFTNATLTTLQGLKAGYPGQLVMLESLGAGAVNLEHENAGSLAPNRLLNIVTSGATTLAAVSGRAIYTYDDVTQRWRMLTAGAAGAVGTGDLTRVNDTNVTVTLGGTPVDALFNDVSLTLGWTGLLGLARGGTNADLSATGGAGRVLKQVSAGAAVTVATLTAAEIASGAALTRVNDTNVTATLGGAPTTALLTAASITLGWTGTLALARGGLGFDASTIAKGGLISGTAAGAVGIVAVGANATVLTADSTVAGGVKWAVPTTGTVTGSGTTGTIPKWTSSTALGNSLITEASTSIGIGARLQVTAVGTNPAAGAGIEIQGGTSPNIAAINRSLATYISLNYDGLDYFWYLSSVVKMAFTSAAKLGIGTVSPNYDITINRASVPGLQMLDSSSGGTGSSNGFTMALSTGDLYFNQREAKAIYLATTNAIRWGINAAGDFTFGASSHIALSNGAPASVTDDGGNTWTIATGSTDSMMVLSTIGGGVASVVTITFGHTFNTAPPVVAQSRQSAGGGVQYATSTTTTCTVAWAAPGTSARSLSVLVIGF